MLDRPGSFYDMQNDIEDELETSSDDAQAIESKEKFVLDIYVLWVLDFQGPAYN